MKFSAEQLTHANQALLDALPIAAWIKDLNLRYVWSNARWSQLLASSAPTLNGLADSDFLPDWFCERFQFEDLAVLASQQERVAEFELPKDQQDTTTVRCFRYCIYDQAGQLNGIAGFAVDISQEKQLRKALKIQIDSQANWLHALKNHALITMMDRHGQFTYVSEQYARLLGTTPKAMLGQSRSRFGLLPQGMDVRHYLALAEQGAPVAIEFSGQRSDDTPFWARSLLIALKSASAAEQIYFELATDLTVEKLTAHSLNTVNDNLIELINKNTDLIAQLEVAARTDPLTGLLNRRALFERAKIEGDRAHRNGTPISIIALDVDHFKQVNDHYGHETGDKALIMLSRWCEQTLRSSDLIARSGGEEFILLLPDTDLEHAQLIAERIRIQVASGKVGASDGRDFSFTVSQGVALLNSAETISEAMARADHALYQAKAEGRNRVCLAP